MSLQSRLADLITAIGADIKDINDTIDGLGGGGTFLDTAREFELHEDFVGELQSELNVVVSGTAAEANNTSSVPDITTIGGLRCSLGTAANGTVRVRTPFSTLVLGNGKALYSARVRVVNLSDGSNRYKLQCGFGNNDFSFADHTDGAYFEYDDSASANWRVRTASASSFTTTTTGVALAINTWYRLEIEINAAGTEAKFYIDGVLVATHTTNIPTGSISRVVGLGVWIWKSIGTTNRQIWLDWIAAKIEAGSSR